MDRLAYAALAALALICSATDASAGVYLSAGVGADAQLSGSLADTHSAADDAGGRVSIGSRKGAWALEGTIAWVGLQAATTERTLLVGAVDVKYFFTLDDRVEAFAKVGLNEGTLEGGSEASRAYEGLGYQVGGGVQLGFSAGNTPMTVWVDYTRATFALRGEAAGGRGGPDSLDGSAQTITVGLSVALR